jgi:heme A synthase
VLVQLTAGLANVLLLAPVWMQIVHLFLADLVWILLILFSSEVLAKVEAPSSIPVGLPSTSGLISGS